MRSFKNVVQNSIRDRDRREDRQIFVVATNDHIDTKIEEKYSELFSKNEKFSQTSIECDRNDRLQRDKEHERQDSTRKN